MQTTILAAGQTLATSSDLIVAPGQTAKVGLFVAAGTVPLRATATVFEVTPGADVPIGQLDGGAPVFEIDNPGTYRVVRGGLSHLGVDVGVFAQARAYSGTLVDGSAAIVDTGDVYPLTVWVAPEAGDTVTVEYRVSSAAPWTAWAKGAATSYTDDVLVGPVAQLRFTRSAGSGTTSTFGVY